VVWERWAHVRDATGRDCNWVLARSLGRIVPGWAGSWEKYQHFEVVVFIAANKPMEHIVREQSHQHQ
jgi:hypothetical protein